LYLELPIEQAFALSLIRHRSTIDRVRHSIPLALCLSVPLQWGISGPALDKCGARATFSLPGIAPALPRPAISRKSVVEHVGPEPAGKRPRKRSPTIKGESLFIELLLSTQPEKPNSHDYEYLLLKPYDRAL
jgi:hypothetical protein